MSGNLNKVLIAIDGSEESLAVVRYASEKLSPATTNVTLFHVMSKVPEVFWDMEKDPAWLEKVEAVRVFQEKQEEIITAFIQRCQRIFGTSGFSEASVSSRIARQQNGIARDLVAEAQKRYDVLIIGRGKAGSLTNMPLGGVASKILNAALTPAIWLVGSSTTQTGRVLIALDSSENSLQSVKHAGKMLSNSDSSITLFHAVRGLTITMEGFEDLFPAAYRKSFMGEAEPEILSALKLAQLWLIKMDISPDRISTKTVIGVRSRAAAILEEAISGEYDTIVMGRRGVSEVMDFSMGRVTNKLTQLARDHALWIVG